MFSSWRTSNFLEMAAPWPATASGQGRPFRSRAGNYPHSHLIGSAPVDPPISAARPLQELAADGRGIAQLRGGARQERFGTYGPKRGPPLLTRMGCDRLFGRH